MIEESLLKSNYIGKDGFIWWIGQVAHRDSWFSQSNIVNPNSWGYRCKVRIVGYHPFDGNLLKDVDLPWAQIMLDPSFGSGQGGGGGTPHLKGGETAFGFFLDGDDGQQPVIVGLLHRSSGTSNSITLENIKKEQSSRFKPFTGHPNNVVKPSQLNSRAEKIIPNDTTPTQTVGIGTTEGTTTIEPQTTTESIQTPPTIDFSKLDTPFSGLSTTINWDSNVGWAYSGVNLDPEVFEKVGFTLSENGTLNYQPGDAIRGIWCNIPALSTLQLEKKADITVQTSNGCQNNLISKITQALQDFMSVTNSLDKYLGLYTDPILNIFVDIQNTISTTARRIGGVIKLIINNFRSTIFKCITWAFRKLVSVIIPLPQQTIVLETMKKILDIVYCIFEKLSLDNIPYIEDLLGDLVDKAINVPLCAAEQWTASILSNLMNSIDGLLENVLSGLDWLVGGIGAASNILNQASSLASQIYSYLECTGLECKEPSVWASKFGLVPKSADDWDTMVSKVNVFNEFSVGIGSVEQAFSQIPLYGNNIAFSNCNQKVYNPQTQDDLMPSGYGTKWSKPIPPIAKIIGDGVGAEAVPIVADDSSIFSVEVTSGGVGYTNGKTILNIIDNSGYGSDAKAKVIIGAGGSIKSIYLTNPGQGYVKGNDKINEKTKSSSGISTITVGCLDEIIIVSPGYGYTTGDTVTDGTNTWRLFVSPVSGSVFKVEPLNTPICGFTQPPTLSINTNTGIGAEVIPRMRFALEDQGGVSSIAGIGVTTVVDCV